MNGDDSFEKSSDIGLGRRPELKSEDFSKLSSPFMRYRDVKTYSQQKKCYIFSELYHMTVRDAAKKRTHWTDCAAITGATCTFVALRRLSHGH